MIKLGADPKKWLQKKVKKGARSYPIGTIAFYGPDNQRASKLVAAVVMGPGFGDGPMKKWFDDVGDVRADSEIMGEVAHFLRAEGAHSVVIADSIMGCPHEEVIDYPQGEKCPRCPFWANRDRFTHEIVQ